MSQEPFFEIRDVQVKSHWKHSFQIRTFQTFPGVNYGIAGNSAELMMEILALLHKPLKGEIKIKGNLLSPWKKAEKYRGSITYINDEIGLFRGTVKDNIKMPLLWKKLKDDQVESRLEELNEELGWGFLYGKDTDDLSKEEYRMAQYLRALALEPEILIISDLSAHLSRKNFLKFEDFLQKHFRMGRSVIFSSSILAHYERLAHVKITVHNEFITRVRTISHQKEEKKRIRSNYSGYHRKQSFDK